MVGSHCENCNLLVEVGHDVYWDLHGSYCQIACMSCGCVHKIEFPDKGDNELLTWAKPIFRTVDQLRTDIARPDWIHVMFFATPERARCETVMPRRIEMFGNPTFSCYNCHAINNFTPIADPVPQDDSLCPNCGQPNLSIAYTMD